MRRLGCAAGDAGGDVQDAVAEGPDLAFGNGGLVGEADEFGPGNKICCRHDYFNPCLVGVEGVAGLDALPGRRGLADAVLDAGVSTVARSSSAASWPHTVPSALE